MTILAYCKCLNKHTSLSILAPTGSEGEPAQLRCVVRLPASARGGWKYGADTRHL